MLHLVWMLHFVNKRRYRCVYKERYVQKRVNQIYSHVFSHKNVNLRDHSQLSY